MNFNKFKQIGLRAGQMVARKQGQSPLKAQPDELFLLAALNSSENEYEISLDHDIQQNVWKGTKGLQWRNEFEAVAMAIGILPVKIASGTKYFGATAPVYWPDPAIFNTAASSVLTEAEALEGIYLGDYTIKTNEGIRIDSQKILGYRHVPETQHGLVYSTDGTNAGSVQYHNEQDGSEFRSLGGVMRFVGGDDNFIKIRIQCEDKSVIAGSSTRANYLCIRLLGSVVKGSTTSKLSQ